MLTWPQTAILEKNKLASDAPFLILVEMTHTALPEPIRVVRNNEDIVWRGNTWEAFPVDFGTQSINGQEEPALDMTISNCGGMLQSYIQQYNGLGDAEVSIFIVHVNLLDSGTPLNELDLVVLETKYDEQWISFRLTASPEIMNRFPSCTYAAQYCPYKFKSVRCGYNGSGGPCKNTADSCLIPSRFGGEEGMNSV